MYDIRSKESFLNISNYWYADVKKNIGDCKCVIVGNKSDLDDERVVNTIQAKEFADKNGIPYIESSAKVGTNVEEIFIILAKQLTGN
jgi:GTPase SAR1 family protein